jgi:hypothetical protein
MSGKKVRVTLKVQCKTSIHVMSALKLIDNSKVLKLLGTNDPHHDTICNAQHPGCYTQGQGYMLSITF